MAKGDNLPWTDDENRAVAMAALKYIDNGVPHTEAFFKAQREALGKDRHRTRKGMGNHARGGRYAKWADLARVELQIKDATRPNPQPPAPPEPPAAKRETSGSQVRWTTREWALIARAVEARLAAGADKSIALVHHVIAVQAEVLPADRQRAPGGLMKGFQAKGQNTADYEKGKAAMWTIEVAERSRPPEPPAEPAEALPMVVEYVAQPAPASAPPAASQWPASPIESRPVVAPSPPAAQNALTAAMQRAQMSFANTIIGAVGDLLTVHEAQIRADMHADHEAALQAALTRQANAITSNIGALIQQALTQGIQAQVLNTLHAELGGPVGGGGGGGGVPPQNVPPVPEPDPVPETPAPSAAAPAPRRAVFTLGDAVQPLKRADKLAVDIVGLKPANQAIVRKALGSEHYDIRMADSEELHFKIRPHAEVFLMVGLVSHGMYDRMRSQRAKLTRIAGGVGAVIQAVEHARHAHEHAAAH